MTAAITSRLKIMANLDISERRLPQDGRIRCTVAGRKLDLRVSTLPNTYGEKTVMRILDTKSINVDLDALGETIEVGGGEQAHALAVRTQHGGREGADAALAVGPPDVNRPKAAFRMAKVGTRLLHALEPELLPPMEQPVQPLQALLEITTHRSSISQPVQSQRVLSDTASSPKCSAFSPPCFRP